MAQASADVEALMVKTIGCIRLARWKHLFTPGGGVAISWNGKRFLVNLEFNYEDRRPQ